MNPYNLSKIYQEMYYHELDVKEKIVNRIQLTFAFHATLLTAIIYMLRMVDLKSPIVALVLFFLCLPPLFFYLIRSIYEAITAFWGNTYKALATSDDVEEYRKSCIEHEKKLKQFKDDNPNSNCETYCPEQSINDFLYKEFSKCASHNSKVNESRSQKNHLAIKYLLFAAIPFFILAFLFTVFDMDTSSPRKRFLIEYQGITNSIEQITSVVKDDLMPLLIRLEDDRIKGIPVTKKIKEIKLTEEHQQQDTEIRKESKPPTPPTPPKTRDILEDTGPDHTLNDGEILND